MSLEALVRVRKAHTTQLRQSPQRRNGVDESFELDDRVGADGTVLSNPFADRAGLTDRTDGQRQRVRHAVQDLRRARSRAGELDEFTDNAATGTPLS